MPATILNGPAHAVEIGVDLAQLPAGLGSLEIIFFR
jgi:hypothetical protein